MHINRDAFKAAFARRELRPYPTMKKVGLSPMTYQGILRGRTVNMQTVWLLAEGLELTQDEILEIFFAQDARKE